MPSEPTRLRKARLNSWVVLASEVREHGVAYWGGWRGFGLLKTHWTAGMGLGAAKAFGGPIHSPLAAEW